MRSEILEPAAKSVNKTTSPTPNLRNTPSISSSVPMDAFTIAEPVPVEGADQVPVEYDHGNGNASGSCVVA
ncbi:hypothetical protein DAEQUDRAFT_726716 [Daedalea quercina L-15889]|uniref:Uncharacterized protein n=1 Tax=Daedalea quercina L-15889 TaxID=1314783 RepID=A0A165QFW8_9APHY|nr:hypothetical protein DAEQUDRAFT_726716 [Daedalea quercina L-15889]